MLPWIVAAALMGVVAAWLGAGLRVVGEDVPRRLARRAAWWRRWAWPVAAVCTASAIAATSAALVC
ncbi:hypothetical protein [Cryptosporangium minutisporangium]|uniref:Uncharacterized protein n=1 Tax=Cryptosporangium minutisporangium TaxID=113569 RepID=A0ABP6T2J6_9ACTN